MAELRWPPEETETMRAPREIAGQRRLTKAKWPRWLVANCASHPSPTRVSGQAMMPALLITISMLRPDATNRSAKTRTLSRSERSIRSISTPSMPATALRAASMLLAPMITLAPAPARARVVSSPRPEWPPVTMARLPERSRPARTSSAVVWAPNPEPMGTCLSFMIITLVPCCRR